MIDPYVPASPSPQLQLTATRDFTLTTMLTLRAAASPAQLPGLCRGLSSLHALLGGAPADAQQQQVLPPPQRPAQPWPQQQQQQQAPEQQQQHPQWPVPPQQPGLELPALCGEPKNKVRMLARALLSQTHRSS